MNPRPLARLVLWSCLLATGLGWTTVARAEDAAADSPEKKNVAYKLSRTDKISIAIVGETDPALAVATKRIDVNGNVNLALILDIHVEGLTVAEAQTAIENAYKDGRFLRNPQVVISIEDYAPRTVTVTGTVKYGGTIPLPPETIMTLKELISKVQLGETANAKAVRISRLQPDGTPKIIIKNVDGVMNAKAGANIADGAFVIEPGDTIYVPEKVF